MVPGSHHTHATSWILALVWTPTGVALPTGQWVVTQLISHYLFCICTCTFIYTACMQMALPIHVNTLTLINNFHFPSFLDGTWLQPFATREEWLHNFQFSPTWFCFWKLGPEYNINPQITVPCISTILSVMNDWSTLVQYAVENTAELIHCSLSMLPKKST